MKKKTNSRFNFTIQKDILPKSKRSNSHFKSVFDYRRLSDSKRSQSEIVVAVLLIMISISLVIILINVVMPFVKKQLEGGDCFEVLDQIEISNNPKYTCFDDTVDSEKMRIQIFFGGEIEKIEGFSIELGGAVTKAYTIKNEASDAEVSMYNSANPVEIPERNEARTYEISGISAKPDFVKVYPTIKGDKVCDESNSLTFIELCPV